MLRQSNYFDSVGEDKSYEWQTPKYNFACLAVTIIIAICCFIFFYFFNRTSLEIADFSLIEENKSNNLLASQLYLSYGKTGDFDFAENEYVEYTMPKNSWKRFRSPAVCRLFAVNFYNEKEIMNDSTVSLNLKNYDYPKNWNKDINKKISKKKEYICYSNLRFSAKFKSSMINPIFHPFVTENKDSLVRADVYNFEENSKEITKDTLTIKRNIHLYGKLSKSTDSSYDATLNKYIVDNRTSFAYGDTKLNSRQISLLTIPRKWKLTNRTCCNLYIKSIEFPCKDNCNFILSFTAPMFFEKLSIEPDITKTNEIVYASPSKIKELKEKGLYVYARDITANNQEMVNFFFATLLGIIISFGIEYWKRLYKYRRQSIYALGQDYHYRKLEKIFVMSWWAWDICRRHFAKNKKRIK